MGALATKMLLSDWDFSERAKLKFWHNTSAQDSSVCFPPSNHWDSSAKLVLSIWNSVQHWLCFWSKARLDRPVVSSLLRPAWTRYGNFKYKGFVRFVPPTSTQGNVRAYFLSHRSSSTKNIVTFFSPLTLIVGHNGAGKTVRGGIPLLLD